MTGAGTTSERPRGLRRARQLWQLWRNEKEEPEPFYSELAADAVADLEARYGTLDGRVIADLGCGPGYYARAFRARGATVIPVEGALEELTAAGAPPAGGIVGDAGRLPLPDGSVDGVFCSNMLEHTPDPARVVREMLRVMKPGGWGYLSWTNWYSPWGGHDMSPYHFLGPELGPKLYERRHGPPRKNRYGEGLFAVHIGPTLKLMRSEPDAVITAVEPRYWPWARAITRVPGVREVFTWNCVIRFTKRSESNGNGGGNDSTMSAYTQGRDRAFEATFDSVAEVDGWMTCDQAYKLWTRARAVAPNATIVEIGSYRGRSAIVLASAAPADAEIVAIDPHAGNDRGPQQWVGTEEEGQSDYELFHLNLKRAGVDERIRHVREFSYDAFGAVDGDVDLLYIDGAHGYAPARDDLVRWGARVKPNGTVLVHDSFSSVGVTLALITTYFFGGKFRYVGRAQSMTEYRREPVRGLGRVSNALRQAKELPWFLRNVLIKLALVTKMTWAARALGHDTDVFPY